MTRPTSDRDPQQPPAGDSTLSAGPLATSGASVGTYVLRELIGSGGMGEVWKAEQKKPVRRVVAVKLIKPGMDSREVLARFEAERQALALMDHPGIAKVYEAGTTDLGRPYFVMEYVRGVPVTEYCDSRRLAIVERLVLFERICEAVQHAHQKAVIHRDIKPANILVVDVDGQAMPKIIDFGVAKATSQRLTEQTVYTALGQLVGTPEYMSPEQADLTGEDVDTRTDVYSLGVVLYELLAGAPPFEANDLRRAGFEGVVRMLREQDPQRPSTKVSSLGERTTQIASSRRTAPKQLTSRLQGDLDWIVMRCLEKDRNRRYSSPLELAQDIKRHLGNQPVLAGPPDAMYRLGKFLRRNRLAVTMSVLVLAALVAGAIGTTVGMIRARDAEAVALEAAERAEAATLYQIALAENRPALALPSVVAAIERDDRIEYRLMAKDLLNRSPTFWRLPVVEDSHNPYAIDISADGKWMAVGWSRKGNLQLYAFTGGEPRLLEGHRNRVTSVEFSPDSRILVSAAMDSSVIVWSLPDGNVIKRWHAQGEFWPYLDYDNRRIVVCVAEEQKELHWLEWSLDDAPPRDLGHAGPVLASLDNFMGPDVSYERNWIVQPVENRVQLYSLEDLTAGPLRTLGQQDTEVRGVVFSPDGNTVASYDAEGDVYLWDANSTALEPKRKLKAYHGSIFLRFDATGRRLAVSGYGGMRIWDLRECTMAAPLELKSSPWMFAGAFHPEADWFVTTGTGGLVSAWPDISTRPLTLVDPVDAQRTLGFSPDGRHLILGSASGTVRDVPLDGTKIGEPRILHQAEQHQFVEVEFDDASRYVFLAVCNSPKGVGSITRIDLESGDVRTFDGMTCSLFVDGTGRYVASSSDEVLGAGYVRILDTVTEEIYDLDESRGAFTHTAGWTQDGRLVVFAVNRLGVWDHAEREFREIGDDIADVRLARDRRTLAVVSLDGRLWRQSVDGSAREALPLTYDPRRAYELDVDSTASYITVSPLYGPAELLDMTTGHRYFYPVSSSELIPVAIDPKGRWLAVSDIDEEGKGYVKFVPRPQGVPFEDLPREALLDHLHSLTNLRTEPDDAAQFGFRTVGQGVPDWQHPPR